ncbi:helix-turn-helix domain-containing protein [Paenibacillus sp. 1P07SE]|uniref:helix-turn-helix domain-containing protein n=1 Tax=Paenibacillus sp. 1P07SE TaxID=3132209 RepID=UPI0039A415BE
MSVNHYEFSMGINSLPAQGELAVLFSGYGRPMPKHRMGPAVHNYYLIHTVKKGYGTLDIGGKRYNCRAGDSFVIFPGELFTYTADADTPWEYQWVAFKGVAARPLLEAYGVSPLRPVLHHADIRRIRVLYDRIRLAFLTIDSPMMADLEAGGQLRLLLRQFGTVPVDYHPVSGNRQSDMERQISQMAMWLSLQYDQNLSIAQIAKTLGYHRTHLSKMFKQVTGHSPSQYLYRVRMQRAESLLGSELTIGQVASSVGFPDPLYFSKQFRRWSGLTPTAYRRSLTAQAKASTQQTTRPDDPDGLGIRE